ncbi:DUF2059 domain-containing protein [Parasphingorhabdus sp.]|uniref:DUF2059 domain-containing protein n=1 Tax=Parasphingorhabdus sp. TaxID=2709688 RepID=UPI003A8EBFD0
MIKTPLIAGLALIVSAPVHGRSASEEPTAENFPAREAVEASYRLLDSTRYDEQVKASALPMSLAVFDEILSQNMEKEGVVLDDDLLQQLRSTFAEEMDQLVEEFTQDSRIEAGLVYARYYSAAELDRLTEIHKDPVMQKSLVVGPKLQTELMTVGMQNMRKHLPGIEERMKAVLEEYLSDLLTRETS